MTAEHPIRVEVGPRPENGHRPSHPPTAQTRPSPIQTPFIDIHEGPDGLLLEADLPGVSQGGVAIQLEDNVLALQAKVDALVPEGAHLLHEEYRHGEFQRSFILSDEVDREMISAELKNGVLRLTLPKAERAKTRRIEIKSS